VCLIVLSVAAEHSSFILTILYILNTVTLSSLHVSRTRLT
jgi:tripeptidyl-peptidase I